MEFSRLCALSRIVTADLAAAIRAQAPMDELTSRFLRLTTTGEAIMAHAPRDRTEHDEMVAFFARRAATTPDTAAASRDYARVAALFADDPQSLPEADPAAPPLLDAAEIAASPEPDALAAWIATTPERAALVGPDYRYVAASWEESRSQGYSPARIAGLHLGEIVGYRHFERSFRPKLQRVFTTADEVDYSYRTVVPLKGQRLVQLHARPVTDSRGRVPLALLSISEVPQKPLR